MTMSEYYRDCRKFDKLPYHEQVETLNEFIDKDVAHWKDVYCNGSSDPFWSDGVNLNLIRNHIIAWLIRLYELDRSERQLTLFDFDGSSAPASDYMEDRRLPPEVDSHYMAKDRVVFGESLKASKRDLHFD